VKLHDSLVLIIRNELVLSHHTITKIVKCGWTKSFFQEIHNDGLWLLWWHY